MRGRCPSTTRVRTRRSGELHKNAAYMSMGTERIFFLFFTYACLTLRTFRPACETRKGKCTYTMGRNRGTKRGEEDGEGKGEGKEEREREQLRATVSKTNKTSRHATERERER